MSEQRPASYSDRLYNEDLGALKQQNWNWYNIFAFWMSDVHSVGGYVFAGSLFALGLNVWQVLLSLLIGICLVNLFCNLVAKPSQQAGIPYPVVCRMSFGVYGANVPAIIRGLIAVAWYGIQTFLASSALNIILLRFFPQLAGLTHGSLLGLSYLGWLGFMIMWTLQAIVFWHGMESIRKFIDWAGPAVYAVMLLLAAWIVWRAGPSNISPTLSETNHQGLLALGQMAIAIAWWFHIFPAPCSTLATFPVMAKHSKRSNAAISGACRSTSWPFPSSPRLSLPEPCRYSAA